MNEEEAIKGIERLIKWFEKLNKDYVLVPEDKVYFETVLNLIKKQDKMIDEMAYYLSYFDIDEMCEKCDRCIGNGCYADDDMEFKINCIKQYFENKVTDTNVGERKVENGN